MKDKEIPNFELILENLHSILEAIERNEGDVEGSLKAYEKGVDLVLQAQKYLTDAEQRVSLLSKDLSNTKADPKE